MLEPISTSPQPMLFAGGCISRHGASKNEQESSGSANGQSSLPSSSTSLRFSAAHWTCSGPDRQRTRLRLASFRMRKWLHVQSLNVGLACISSYWTVDPHWSPTIWHVYLPYVAPEYIILYVSNILLFPIFFERVEAPETLP